MAADKEAWVVSMGVYSLGFFLGLPCAEKCPEPVGGGARGRDGEDFEIERSGGDTMKDDIAEVGPGADVVALLL